jgi:peptide/nickel transport system substrate-binding protein
MALQPKEENVYRSSALRTLVLTVVLLALAGASLPTQAASSAHLRPAAAKTTARIVVGMPIAVNSLDPDIASSEGDYIVHFSLEFLLKLSPTGKIEPNLAQSVTQKSPTVYIYHLRHGVKFSDGTELTSADVVNAINYEIKANPSSAVFFGVMKSIKATDRYTVTVTLKQADAGWAYTFTYTGYIFEKSFQDKHKKTMGQPGTLIVGTGPYIPKSLDPAAGAEFAANPHYWGGKPVIQHISVKFFSSEQGMALAFRAGEIDLAFPADPRSWVSTAGSPVKSVPSAEQAFFSMDTKSPPFDDIHVRRAIAYAINRNDIIAAAGGYATPDYTMIPPVQLEAIASKAKVNALIKSLPKYTFNLTKAKQEMAKSSHPNGFTTTIDTFQYASFPDVDQTIAGDLAKIGITMNVNIESVNQYVDEFTHKGFITQYTYFYSQSPDPGYIPSIALDSSQAKIGLDNFAMYTNPAVDKQIAIGNATSNKAKRFAAYSKMLKLVANDVPILALFEGNNNLAIDKKFSFPTFNAYTTDHTPYIMQIQVK